MIMFVLSSKYNKGFYQIAKIITINTQRSNIVLYILMCHDTNLFIPCARRTIMDTHIAIYIDEADGLTLEDFNKVLNKLKKRDTPIRVCSPPHYVKSLLK